MATNTGLKNVGYALAIPIFGFALLNVAFVLDSLLHSAVGLLFPEDFPMTSDWFAPTMQALFAVIIGFVSWPIFRSSLREIYKAIYATVPVGVTLAVIGALLNRWPALVYTLGALIFGAIIVYLYRTQKSWLYYYAVSLVTSALLAVMLLGIDI